MTFVSVSEKEKKQFNDVITHPLQTYEWGTFREKTGIKVIRRAYEQNRKITEAFQMTIHPIPHTPWTIGYLPKGTLPTRELLDELYKIGKEEQCIFIQLEPDIKKQEFQEKRLSFTFGNWKLKPAAHPLFTKYTFQLDLTQSEETLLANMHPKTRYNLRVAQKHSVEVREETSEEAFAIYWKLMQETTERQGFYAHTKRYHQLMWEALGKKNPQGLEAHLFIAWYKPPEEEKEIPLVAWVLFTLHDHLYYPYGASSREYRNVMASQAMMWHAIQFGKTKGLKVFDMWGSLGENPNAQDPWYGFHRLKQGFGPQLVEFIGSYDLVINPVLYQGYKVADKLRWILLTLRK